MWYVLITQSSRILRTLNDQLSYWQEIHGQPPTAGVTCRERLTTDVQIDEVPTQRLWKSPALRKYSHSQNYAWWGRMLWSGCRLVKTTVRRTRRYMKGISFHIWKFDFFLSQVASCSLFHCNRWHAFRIHTLPDSLWSGSSFEPMERD